MRMSGRRATIYRRLLRIVRYGARERRGENEEEAAPAPSPCCLAGVLHCIGPCLCLVCLISMCAFLFIKYRVAEPTSRRRSAHLTEEMIQLLILTFESTYSGGICVDTKYLGHFVDSKFLPGDRSLDCYLRRWHVNFDCLRNTL